MLQDGDVEDDYHFVEVTGITISDIRRRPKYTIALHHKSGAKETFVTNGDLECQTFIELSCPTTIELTRTDKLQKSKAITATLQVEERHSKFHRVSFAPDASLDVSIKLGENVSSVFVCKARLAQAIAALETKAGICDALQCGTKFLQLFVDVGSVAAELSSISQAVVALIRIIFEKVQNVTESYVKVKNAIDSLADELESAVQARAVFKSDYVRGALEKLLTLVIRACMTIEKHYSSNKSKFLVKGFFSSNLDNVTSLRRDIERHKEVVRDAYLTEIQRNVSVLGTNTGDIVKKVSQVTEGIDELRNEASSSAKLRRDREDLMLLEKLVPPDESIFHGKSGCLSGTRLQVLDRILDWATSKEPVARLYWLYGVAGCGKSSVAVSVCRCLQHEGRIPGSFFCKRDHDDRRNPVRFLWSIAFHLALANTRFKFALLRALRQPDVFVNKGFEAQLERLLEQPLKDTVADGDSEPIILVVDALDECSDEEKVTKLLLSLLDWAPFLLIFMTSRDHPSIRKTLERDRVSKVQHDLFNVDATDDIRSFVRFNLSSEGMLADLEPFLEDKVELIVSKSQGLFIWVSTAISYIARTEVGKLESIDHVFEGSNSSHAEDGLDEMYRIVLDNAAGTTRTGQEVVRFIIGVLRATSSLAFLSEDALYAFLPSTMLIVPAEFKTVLAKLLPVLVVDERGVRAYHASFLDFVATENRCGTKFSHSQAEVHRLMFEGCFEIMLHGTRNARRQRGHPSGLRFNICELQSSAKTNDSIADLEERVQERISPELQYSSVFWFNHLSLMTGGSGDQHSARAVLRLDPYGWEHEVLKNLFCSIRSLWWLEAICLIGKLQTARSILVELQDAAARADARPLCDNVSDLRHFVDNYLFGSSISTPHIYVSGLSWVSESSRHTSLIEGRQASDSQQNRTFSRPLRQRTHILHCIQGSSFSRVLAISPDGTNFIADTEDKCLVMWDIFTGSQIGDPFRGGSYGERFSSVDMERDGTRLASSFEESNDIFVWDIKSRELAFSPLSGHSGIVNCVRFSRYEDLLASGSNDATVRIWHAKTGECLRRLIGHSGPVTTLAFHRHSPYLKLKEALVITGSEDCSIRLWDIKKGSCIATKVGHKKRINSVTSTPDGRHIASASSDYTIRLWNLGKEPLDSPGKPLQNDACSVQSAVFSSDGCYIFTGYGDSTVRVWDLQSGSLIGMPLGIRGVAKSCQIATTVDGTRVLFASDQRTIMIWDADVISHSKEPFSGLLCTHSVKFSRDGMLIACGSNNRFIYLYDALSGELATTIQTQHLDGVYSLEFSPDGKRIASGSGRYHASGNIWIWDVGSHEAVHGPLVNHTDWVSSLAFSPDGSKLLSGSRDCSACIWDAETGSLLHKLVGHTSFVPRIGWSPDAKRVVTGSHDCTIRIWSAEDGSCILGPLDFGERVDAVLFSPDASVIASSGYDRYVRIWDAGSGDLVKVINPTDDQASPILAMHFLPDARLLIGAEDGTVRCWDVLGDGNVSKPLYGHTRGIRCMDVSPDGKRLVTGSHDSTVRVWDIDLFNKDPEVGFLEYGHYGPDKVPAHIPEDGWIRTAKKELILWVPFQFRNLVCDMSMVTIAEAEDRRPIRILWDKLPFGENWTKIWDSYRNLQ